MRWYVRVWIIGAGGWVFYAIGWRAWRLAEDETQLGWYLADAFAKPLDVMRIVLPPLLVVPAFYSFRWLLGPSLSRKLRLMAGEKP